MKFEGTPAEAHSYSYMWDQKKVLSLLGRWYCFNNLAASVKENVGVQTVLDWAPLSVDLY